MELTANEAKALQAIVDSNYQDGSGEDTIDYEVWTVYSNPFENKRTQSGVYSSLSKKGLITTGREDDFPFDTVAITEAGYTALAKIPDGGGK